MSTTTTRSTDFDVLYQSLARWRQWMVDRHPTFDDVAAIIDESLWTQHSSGVTDRHRLMRCAEIAVRRHCRREARYASDLRARLMVRGMEPPPPPLEEQVVEAVAALECLRRMDITPRAWKWLHRLEDDETLSRADESYGRRWAARTRKGFAHVA